MPNKIDPNNVTLTLIPQHAQDTLLQFQELIIIVIASHATTSGKTNALRIIETFKFISVNSEWISQAFTEEKEAVFQNERDKEHGVLRDHQGTAFHLNSYTDATTALASLNRISGQFIAAMRSLKDSKYLQNFINACTDIDVGCLEARVSPALMFYVKTQSGIPDFPEFVNEQLMPYQRAEGTYIELLMKLKAATWPYLGELYQLDGEVFSLSWERFAMYLRRDIFLIDNEDEAAKSFTEGCSPIQNYFDFLRFANATVRLGQLSMFQHRFKSQKEAQVFKQWLCSLACLDDETALHRTSIHQEGTDFVVRLTSAQLEKIQTASPMLKSVRMKQWMANPDQFYPNPVLVSPKEIKAEACLGDPFYAKTITGFGNLNAWISAIHGVTLRSKVEKPVFRNPLHKLNKPFHVRLNLTAKRLEVHKRDDATTGLFRQEKAARLTQGQIPIPPHQSFTYYDPSIVNFRPAFLSPSCLNPEARKEIIGLRIAKKDGLINRILSKDLGTYNVFYGFGTEQEAKTYLKQRSQEEWPLSLEQLTTIRSSSKLNEVMIRAQWCCDGTSQVLVYPPHDSLCGRYKAILYARDLEKRLAAHPEIYSKPPIQWTEDYRVPIAFFSNDGQSRLYYQYEQEEDLQKPAQTTRESFLKIAITYLYTGQVEREHPDVIKFIENILNAPEERINITLLDFVSCDIRPFYFTLVQEILNEGKKLSEHDLNNKTLQQLLLAGDPKTGAAILFRWASQEGLVEVVNAMIDATNHLPETQKIETLKQMLLAEHPGQGPASAFRVASQYGHVEVVKALVDATNHLPEAEKINTLKQMLLAGYSSKGPAYAAFILASQNGHAAVVKALVDATNYLPEAERILTLKQVLLAEHLDHGPAFAFRVASQQGYVEVVRALVDTTNYLPEAERIVTLKKMLLAEHPAQGPASAFRVASQQGYIEVLKTLVDATNYLPEAERIATLKQMLLAEHPVQGPASAFRVASRFYHGEIVQALFNVVFHLPAKDMNEVLHHLIRHAPNGINEWIKIHGDKPKILFDILLKSNSDHRLYLLSRASKHLNLMQQENVRQYIISKLVKKPDINTIKKEYAHHAGFFSLSRMAMQNDQNPIARIIRDAETHFGGASMLTLLTLLDLQHHIITGHVASLF